jgi:energy-converting hydrogenase Eha subunit F
MATETTPTMAKTGIVDRLPAPLVVVVLELDDEIVEAAEPEVLVLLFELLLVLLLLLPVLVALVLDPEAVVETRISVNPLEMVD